MYYVRKAARLLAGEGPRALWRAARRRLFPGNNRRRLREYARYIAVVEPKLPRGIQSGPLCSVAVPLWNTGEAEFAAMARSVLGGAYRDVELVLYDASDLPLDFARELAQNDPRVRYLAGPNLGIARNTAAAVAEARGAYIALLDHDDALAPHAIGCVMARAAETGADFLYTDEDKLNARGERCHPHFKPDYSPETLLSYNYITHLAVFARDLYDRAGGFREGYDGAQDYDLFLRMAAAARRVEHIPQVLYHWRMGAGSTAADSGNKSYAAEAGVRALRDALPRYGLEGTVREGLFPTTYHIELALAEEPLVSVIIPNHEHAADLRRCVESLYTVNRYRNIELIVVENGSAGAAVFDLYGEIERRYGARILRWDEPFHYSLVNNFGAAAARGELLFFLNNDTACIAADSVREMAAWAIQPPIGAVGAKLLYPDYTVQHAGVVVGLGGVAGHVHKHFPDGDPGYATRLGVAGNFSAVTAAAMMVAREKFWSVGGFSPDYPLAFNDVDLCLQLLRAGYRNLYTPCARFLHFESVTRGIEDTRRKEDRFRREIDAFKLRWGAFLERGDPCYNPNLSLDDEDFRIRL